MPPVFVLSTFFCMYVCVSMCLSFERLYDQLSLHISNPQSAYCNDELNQVFENYRTSNRVVVEEQDSCLQLSVFVTLFACIFTILY